MTRPRPKPIKPFVMWTCAVGRKPSGMWERREDAIYDMKGMMIDPARMRVAKLLVTEITAERKAKR